MTGKGYESYYIKGNELAFLLVGKGRKRFWGINLFEQEQEVTKEEMYRVMGDLYQKDYIEWEENYVVIKQPWKQIIHVLVNAKYCLIVEKDAEKKLFYFYNNDIILTEVSQRDFYSFKVTVFTKEEFIKYLWEDNFWPEEEMDQSCYEEENPEETEDEVKTTFSFVNTKNGQILEELILQEKAVLPFVTIKNKETRYEKEWCQTWILSWIEGGKEEEYDSTKKNKSSMYDWSCF